MNCEEIINLVQENVSDWVAIVISVVALILSILQFHFERNRNRKEATIHAFDALEDCDSVIYLFSLSKREVDDLVERKRKNDQRIEEKWGKLNTALPLIEHFAVGINNKIYDIAILNSMAGNQLISTYYACENLIALKRDGIGKEKNYSEFQKMIERLVKLRRIKKQSLPAKD